MPAKKQTDDHTRLEMEERWVRKKEKEETVLRRKSSGEERSMKKKGSNVEWACGEQKI